jgi:hypothetical protein
MSGLSSYDDSSWASQSPRRRRQPIIPIIMTGLIAAVLFARNSPLVSWLRGFFSEIPEPAKGGGTSLLDRGVPLPLIRDSILGRGKSAVAALYGTPRTAAEKSARKKRNDFWNANTWYYPIETRSQTAMAVRFEKGLARKVDFFEAPRLTDAS